MSASGSVKVIVFALSANLGIAAAKYAGAFFSGSASLLAEAIHSTVDCANQIFLLIGNRAARKMPTERHPLGFGREAFFWSFMVAILLFSLGGLFAIYEGVHKLSDHEPLSHPALGMAILAFGVALESMSFHACLKEIRRENPGMSLWQWFRKTTSAEVLVIFTEDLAALLGLAAAAICLGMAWVSGDPSWDASGSIIVGALLVLMSFFLALEIKSLIIGEAPNKALRPEIESLVRELIPGGSVIRFIAVQIGQSEVLVSYKIHPGTIQSVKDLIDRINEIERRARAKFPEIRWQFVEPDYEA